MKPILFNTEMVRAILDGRKTVTRRVVMPKHLRVLDSHYHKEHPEVPDKTLLEKLCLPPYQPGDILWVRETWCQYGKLDDNDRMIEGTEKHYYRADGENPTPFNDFLVQHPGRDEHRETPVWHPSIHMPKEAARLFLRVTDVRVELLQDIDDDGAKAEGANYQDGKNVGWEEKMRRTAIDRFAEIWDNTIKLADRLRYGWAANPWVFVIEFERISKDEALGGGGDG